MLWEMQLAKEILGTMKENTNKAIAINTLILYSRLIICAVCGLLASRYALKALGVSDFGIFSVVGSVISFIAIINTIMLSTSNRFIAVAIGKNNEDEINEQFNVNLSIHLLIALIIAVIAMPLGDWYISNYVNYDGGIENVKLVYNISIWGSVFSFIGVPYNGLLMAKERFLVFCITDVICHIIKVIGCYVLIYHFVDKLLIYTIIITVLTSVPTVVYALYCHRSFKEYVKFRIVKKWEKYKSVLSFSVWVGYGALATVGKTQGSALIVNVFFNTVMNTALGLANTVNALLLQLAGNVSNSISPQITKSLAGGNQHRAVELTCMSSKISFLFMLFISSPFLLTPSYLFQIWLGEVPDYVVIFTELLIIDALIGTLNRGIPELIFAGGNIKCYQLSVNTLFLISVVAAYFVLKAGAPAYSIITTYIVFSIIVLVVRQYILHKVMKINNWVIVKKSYIPSLLVTFLYLPFLFLHPDWHPLVINTLSLGYLFVLIAFVGASKEERLKILIILKNHISNTKK